ITILEQIQAAGVLVGFADRPRRLRQGPHTAQETAIGFVLPRHRAETLPAVATQQIQPTVVAGTGERVGGDNVVVDRFRGVRGALQGGLGERRPGDRSGRILRGHLHRIGARVERVFRIVQFRKEYRLRSEQITERGHAVHCARPPGMLDRLAFYVTFSVCQQRGVQVPHPTDDEKPTRSESGPGSPTATPDATDTGTQLSQAADAVTSRIRRALGRDSEAGSADEPAPGESNAPTEALPRASAADSDDTGAAG